MSSLPTKQDIVRGIIHSQRYQTQQQPQYLTPQERLPGFTLLLMKIGFEQSEQQQIRWRVLLKLQKMIRYFWRGSGLIRAEEKHEIKNQIISSFLKCEGFILTKVYRQIITSIMEVSENVWNPLSIALQKIRIGQNTYHCLHILLAIASRTSFNSKQLMTLAASALPMLLDDLCIYQTSQLIYLSVKLVWKIVSYNVEKDLISIITQGWMKVFLGIIGLRNPEYDNKRNQVQKKWSEQFYYFHSKKWAMRIVLIYIQSLTHPQNLFAEHKQKAKKYAKSLQYDTLINYLKYQTSDEELALQDPINFIKFQRENKVRKTVIDLWFQFYQLEKKNSYGYSTYYPSPNFKEHMEFLNDRLYGNDEQEKYVVLYLIGEIGSRFYQNSETGQIMKAIIEQSVVPNFLNSNFLIKARALEVFLNYGQINYQCCTVNKIIKSIHYCIFEEEHEIVRIRAISVLSLMVGHKDGHELTVSFVKDAIFVILELIQRYKQIATVRQLQTILAQFPSQIPAFAFQLIKQLWEIYLKITQSIDDDQEQEISQAYQTIYKWASPIKLIIESPLNAETFTKIEPFVVSFISSFMVSNGYLSTALDILNAFLSKVKVLTQKVFFFFQVIVYSQVDYTPVKWSKIAKDLQQEQIYIINNARNNTYIQQLSKCFPFLKIYISKVSQMKPGNDYQNFKNNLICLIFHLIRTVYQKGSFQQIGELNITLCTLLMMSLIQNFKKSLPKNVYVQIWEFSKINMIKYLSGKLKMVNSQLFGLLLWADPLNILAVIHRQNMLNDFVQEITRRNYDYEYQRTRVILGINSILVLPQKPSFLLPFVPGLFRQNVNLVQRNINKRFEFQAEEDSQQQDSYFQQSAQQQDQHDSLNWYYRDQYDQECRSILGQTDEIVEFHSITSKISNGQLTITAPPILNPFRQKLNLAVSMINSIQNEHSNDS